MREQSKRFKSNFPTCCLSASRCSTLMWSYYTDGHRGICVHIDATKEPFDSALRVNYDPLYPVISARDGKLDHDLDDQLKLMLLTKSEDWNHECEYRLINLPTEKPKHVLDDLFKWKEPQLAVVPPAFIVGVTVGACMGDLEIEKIKHICNERTTKIPVFKANCRKNQFDLDFSQIA